jgi:putative thiamine transport system permease protein
MTQGFHIEGFSLHLGPAEAVALASGGRRRPIGAYALLQLLLPALGFGLAMALARLLFRHRRGMAAR